MKFNVTLRDGSEAVVLTTTYPGPHPIHGYVYLALVDTVIPLTWTADGTEIHGNEQMDIISGLEDSKL